MATAAEREDLKRRLGEARGAEAAGDLEVGTIRPDGSDATMTRSVRRCIEETRKRVDELRSLVAATDREAGNSERVNDAAARLIRAPALAMAPGVDKAGEGGESGGGGDTSLNATLSFGAEDATDTTRELERLTGVKFSRATSLVLGRTAASAVAAGAIGAPRFDAGTDAVRRFDLRGRTSGRGACSVPFTLVFHVLESSRGGEPAEPTRDVIALEATVQGPHSAALVPLGERAAAERSPRVFLTEIARFARFLSARRDVFDAAVRAHPTYAVAPRGTSLSDTLIISGTGLALGIVVRWTCELENAHMTENISARPLAMPMLLASDENGVLAEFEEQFATALSSRGVAEAIRIFSSLCVSTGASGSD